MSFDNELFSEMNRSKGMKEQVIEEIMDSEDPSSKSQSKSSKKNVFNPSSKVIQRNKEQALEFGEEIKGKGG